MNKRGISDIIVTILLVLLALVLVIILWVVIRNMTKGSAEKGEVETFLSDFDVKNAVVDESGVAQVTVSRGGGKEDVKVIKFKLIFYNLDGSETVEKEDENGIVPLQERKINIILDGNEYSKVKVYPVFDVSGKEVVSKIGYEKEIKGGTVEEEPEPVCGDGICDENELECNEDNVACNNPPECYDFIGETGKGLCMMGCHYNLAPEGTSCTNCEGGICMCDDTGNCNSFVPTTPLAFYKFEGNADDEVGSNHGVVYGTLLEFDSAGYDDSGGSHIYLKVNGLNKLVDGGRGHNAIRLNSTGDYIESKHWDTYDGFTSGHTSASAASDDLANWLNNLPNGDIVLMGVSDSAENINTNAKNMIINKLGSSDINSISLRSSWGIIGVIGEGKKAENYKSRYAGPSIGSWNGYNYNSYDAGIKGKALNFDGVNDYVAIGDKADILSGGLTISAWIKPANTIGVHLIVGKGDSGSINDNLLNYEIYQSGTELGFKVGDGINQYTSSKPASLDTNWHHVVGVYDGTSVTTYVDSVSGSSVAAATSLYNANMLLIGLRETSTNAYPFNGLIDEVRIYNTALSPDEINYIYNSEKP